MFYPQLAAGPIERPQNMLPQFYEKKYFSYNNMVVGLNFIALGLFKKIVVADRLAVYVNQVYHDLDKASNINVLLAMIFFAFQIYCDFSGYSDIARGTAKCMGYDLMINFKRPFLSKNITEFWRRWHISLSTWFNDYLFTPLVINWRDIGKWGVVMALLVTFSISGLWHGAGWCFILYGFLHGLAVAFEFLTKKPRKNIANTLPPILYDNLSRLLTFCFVCLGWVLFRSENFSQASLFYQKLFSGGLVLDITQISAGKGPFNLFLSFLVIGLLFASYGLPKNLKMKYNVSFLLTVLFLIVIFGKNGSPDFIYFQF
jgi:D-alanyl-lipoteichoic acid acyltransferase DltB (MBOAT superfamily)